MDITIGEFPSYILQVPNHAFSNHPNKGSGDRDLGQCMASTNYSCISTSNSWQCVQCQLAGWHQSTGPSLHKEREAPWTEQDQWLVSVGPKWCWLSDCTYNCVCVYLVVGENGQHGSIAWKTSLNFPLCPGFLEASHLLRRNSYCGHSAEKHQGRTSSLPTWMADALNVLMRD